MRLKHWLKLNNHTYKTFGEVADVAPRNVEMWANGKRLPRWGDAKKIFLATDNQVSGQDLYDEQIQRQETNLQREEV